MIKALPTLLLLTIYHIAYGQVDAVVPDSTLDKYYINYPMVNKPLYSVGDTVAAVYPDRPTSFEEAYGLLFRYLPPIKPKPLYVVRAIVTELDTNEAIGVKIKIFSIEKHHNGNVTSLNEYQRPYSECVLKTGRELWREVYDWQNITGLYRIRKFTDNYHVGDTVYRRYTLPATLVGGIFKKSSNKHYSLMAIIRDIDTTDAQRLLLEFITIEYSYSKHNIFYNEFRNFVEYPEVMQYEYVTVRTGDLVWTKPYYWFPNWQRTHRNDGTKIPSGTGMISGCGFRLMIYDCDGNRLWNRMKEE